MATTISSDLFNPVYWRAARLIGILGVATLPETLLLSDQVCQESFGSVVARLPGNFVSHVRTLVA
jgi:hypothetical protein